MKKLSVMGWALAALLTFGLSSCSDDNSNSGQLSAHDQELQAILVQDVNATINPTYTALADSCTELYNEVKALRDAAKTKSVTQEAINKACGVFLGARANYERSEAFLLGAADLNEIDPHIDSWPLDKAALATQLANKSQVESFDADEDGTGIYSTLGQSLVGFHSIEFILFRDGAPRKAEELNGYDSYNKDGIDLTKYTGEYELIYARAVAADLRNSVYRLQCGWNSAAPSDRKKLLDDAGLPYLMANSVTYGDNLVKAGQVGSTYQTVKSAITALLTGNKGCVGISDEVGNAKLANPLGAGNADEADINYVESPYSKHSKYDFYDNLGSIKNVWMGGVDKNEAGQANGTRDDSKASFYNYFKKYNPAMNDRVLNAIDKAQKAILAIPGAFVDYCQANYGKNAQEGEAAIQAVLDVSKALQEAEQDIQKRN